MKKSLVVILATVVLLLGYSLPGEARFRGGVWIDPRQARKSDITLADD